MSMHKEQQIAGVVTKADADKVIAASARRNSACWQQAAATVQIDSCVGATLDVSNRLLTIVLQPV